MLRISLGEARKRSTNGMNKGRNDQNWSGKERKNRRKARRARATEEKVEGLGYLPYI